MRLFRVCLSGLLVPMLAVLPAAAADDRLPMEDMEGVLAMAADFGFQRYEEIQIEDSDRVEIEGWIDEEWFAEVDFNVRDGSSGKEERERMSSEPSGMSDDAVRQALRIAAAEGMTMFEEIEINRAGHIEVEGRDGDGREIEVVLDQAGELREVKRD